MFSVTGWATVDGGGGRMMPLPPFISVGLSAAKERNENSKKMTRPMVVWWAMDAEVIADHFSVIRATASSATELRLMLLSV